MPAPSLIRISRDIEDLENAHRQRPTKILLSSIDWDCLQKTPEMLVLTRTNHRLSTYEAPRLLGLTVGIDPELWSGTYTLVCEPDDDDLRGPFRDGMQVLLFRRFA